MLKTLLATGAVLAAAALPAAASTVYLNYQNTTVAVGPNTSAGSSNNTFTLGKDITKVIDAETATSGEVHDQVTHIWYTFTSSSGFLELLFDFNTEYDITMLHFWNYDGEFYDVDNIAFDFFNAAGTQVGSTSLEPALGTSPTIFAQDIPLVSPLNVKSVIARLSGSNGQVDFQNIGFTASVSVPVGPDPGAVPLPAGLPLLVGGLASFLLLRKRRG